ncbi:hypothetical protein [Nonomuraea sp. NPDC050783]|uniref:hypothetical protein n=1 Tax=Nonomuraea sp. NPDC050783 TaxID=3154634 RepID=UPI00346755F6
MPPGQAAAASGPPATHRPSRPCCPHSPIRCAWSPYGAPGKPGSTGAALAEGLDVPKSSNHWRVTREAGLISTAVDGGTTGSGHAPAT